MGHNTRCPGSADDGALGDVAVVCGDAWRWRRPVPILPPMDPHPHPQLPPPRPGGAPGDRLCTATLVMPCAAHARGPGARPSSRTNARRMREPRGLSAAPCGAASCRPAAPMPIPQTLPAPIARAAWPTPPAPPLPPSCPAPRPGSCPAALGSAWWRRSWGWVKRRRVRWADTCTVVAVLLRLHGPAPGPRSLTLRSAAWRSRPRRPRPAPREQGQRESCWQGPHQRQTTPEGLCPPPCA